MRRASPSIVLWSATALLCTAAVIGVLSSGIWAAETIPSASTDKTGYLVGETVFITATGFVADEQVTLQVTHATGSVETGAGHDAFVAYADASGTIEATWTIGDDLSGNDFLLTANGGATGPVAPAAFRRVAVVQTDRYDYRPGATAVISAAGFRPAEAVTIHVEHSNGLQGGAGHEPFVAFADADGKISTPWFVDPDDSEGSIFRLTATGADSHLTATSTFTDQLVTIVDDAGADDEPGQKDLNYLQVDYSPATSDIGVVWGWDDTSWGGNNTGDACTLFDTDADGFANYSLCLTVDHSGQYQATRLYSCSVDNRSDRCGAPTAVATFSSTGSASIQTVDPFGATGRSASKCSEGGTTGCLIKDTVANLSVRLADFPGSTTAKLINVCSYPSQEPNSDPSDCVVTPNSGFLIITKNANPDDGTSFSFNSSSPSQNGTSSWTINGSGTTSMFSFAPGTISDVTEAVPAGWDLTNASCAIQTATPTATGTRTATGVTDFTIQSGLATICAFTDTKQQSAIRIVKETSGGTAGKTYQFDFTLSGFSDSAVSLTTTGANGTASVTYGGLSPLGTYSIVENGLSGWVQSSATCTNGTPDNIIIVNHETTTCTFRNTAIQPRLTLVKTVTNDNGGTAAASAWTLSASGPTPISGAGGVSNAIAAGSYTLSESGGPSGYTAGNWSCVGGTFTPPNRIALALGENATCTITNDDQTAHLKLVKVVTNNNGGTAAASAWTLTADGAKDYTGAGGFDLDVDAGTYALSESGGPAGYTTTGFDCGTSVTLALGQSRTCTITNDDQTAHLKLVKVVTNNNGGTAAASAWTLTADGAKDYTGAGGFDLDVDAGTYALSESGGPAGYTTTGFDCGTSVTLALGQSRTCTITNDDQTAHLKLVKVVTNNNGGTAAASAWTLTADGAKDYTGAGGFDLDVDAGTYALSESGGPAGYTTTGFDCGTSVTLALGQSRTCTITNDDQTAHLKLVKVVTNNNGGTAAASAWTLTADGAKDYTGAGGFDLDVDAGTYALSESGGPAGYTTTGFDCGTSVTLALGQSRTCTITNDDQTAHLKLVKVVTNNNGGTAAASAWTLTADGAKDYTGAGGFDLDVDAGTYALSESGGPAGYTTTGFDCGTSVTLALGQSRTCTITNDDQTAHLKLVKVVTNNNGGTAAASAWTLTADGAKDYTGAGGFDLDVDAGTYALSESGGPAGYTTTGFDCGTSVTLTPGQSRTCTITNDDQTAHLKLVKVVTNNNGGTAAASAWTLTADGAKDYTGAGGFDLDVDAGTYALSESGGPAGYTTTGFDCGTSVTLTPGQSRTCTITNDDQTAHLKLVKVVTNNNGGTAAASAWILTADGAKDYTGAGGFDLDVDAGTYALSESGGPAGYTTTGFDCGTSVTLTPGQSRTCTITNDDQAAHLKLVKVVTNNNGGTAAASAWTLTADGAKDYTGAGGFDLDVDAGTYALSESGGPAGYTTTGFDCGASVTLALGQSRTCTITNDDQTAHLKLVKVVTNNNGGTAAASAWTLTADGAKDYTGAGGFDLDVDAGTYALSESGGPAGYTTTGFDCGTSVTLALGQSRTCTITNDDQTAHLKLVKVVINDTDGTATAGAFTLRANGAKSYTGAGGFDLDVDAGTYALSETGGPSLYTTTGFDCGASVTLTPGQIRTCTIINHNSARPPVISVDKSVNVKNLPQSGGQVTFTVTVRNDSAWPDPVTIRSIMDNVYGDLTSVNDPGFKTQDSTTCRIGQVIAPYGGVYTCTFTATFAPIASNATYTERDVVEVCGTDDESTRACDTGSASVTQSPPIALTNSSLCTFDMNPSIPGRQFRSLFSQDAQSFPYFRHTATNPGQFFYNLSLSGEPGETKKITLEVPWPFVTQGNRPVHVYDSVEVQENADGTFCFVPGGTEVAIAKYVVLPDYGVSWIGQGYSPVRTVKVELEITIPASRFVYVNQHLDYGLKGRVLDFVNGTFEARYWKGASDAALWPTSTSGDPNLGKVLIPELFTHTFSVFNGWGPGADLLGNDSVQNDNDFKRNPGVGGRVTIGSTDSGTPVVGQLVTLKLNGVAVASAKSDEDGFFLISYKHTGKAAVYTVETAIPAAPSGLTGTTVKQASLKANGVEAVNFEFITP